MSWGGCSQGQQHLSARGDSVGRELCLPKVGHTVNSSNIVGRAKNTNGAEHFPSSCQGPWPRWLGLWPAEGHQGCCGQQRVTRSLTRAAGARLHEEQGMEATGQNVSLLRVYKSLQATWQVGPWSLHRPFCEPGISFPASSSAPQKSPSAPFHSMVTITGRK